MSSHHSQRLRYVVVIMVSLFKVVVAQDSEGSQPNIILIMVDDLGYGDLGCYGQKEIVTPRIDELARKGIRFTNFYSGSPVCAPARSVLMTGRHTGHTTVRGNFGVGGVVGLGGGEGRVPLSDKDTTIAAVLQASGYVTGMTGKWGLGEPGTTGLPNDHGFDRWFGHLNQRRAHSHYPDYLWLDREKYPIPENRDGQSGIYSHDLFTNFALDFIRENSDRPFFLYVPYLIPHDKYEVPEVDAHYVNRSWSDEEKIFASMVTRMDSDVGKIVDLLSDLELSDNTMIFFTSDNGAAQRWEGRFDSSGELRGRKRDMYEGGIKAPMIVSMPGKVSEGVTSAALWSMVDFMPTLAELGKAKVVGNADGIDVSEAIFGNENLPYERVFYWEFHEQGGKQALRKGEWKAVRLDVHDKGFHEDIELYNLSKDPHEKKNLAKKHPEIAKEMMDIMESEHVPSTNFPFKFEIQ